MQLLLFAVMPYATILAVVIYFGRRFARAYELNKHAIREPDDLIKRIAMLEERVERQDREMERLSEGLAFHDQLIPPGSTPRLK
jgi:membrane protein implicated in regulation of membrane protease activity